MISRQTSLAIATAYMEMFSSPASIPIPDQAVGPTPEQVDHDRLYEFLYARSHEAWFCNAARRPHNRRSLKDWFLQIHTGESLATGMPNWSAQQRQQPGQKYLKNLARDFIRYVEENSSDRWKVSSGDAKHADEVRSKLELDGYVYRDGQLLRDEGEVFSVEEETGVLQALFVRLKLPEQKEAFAFLSLCDEHYIAEKWSDSIANARKFLELALRESCIRIAAARGRALTENQRERPVEVRNLLEEFELLEKRERETLDKAYRLLSHTGAHPYMAEKDQARLLRQLTLTLGQFVLLRLEGSLAPGGSR